MESFVSRERPAERDEFVPVVRLTFAGSKSQFSQRSGSKACVACSVVMTAAAQMKAEIGGFMLSHCIDKAIDFGCVCRGEMDRIGSADSREYIPAVTALRFVFGDADDTMGIVVDERRTSSATTLRQALARLSQSPGTAGVLICNSYVRVVLSYAV